MATDDPLRDKATAIGEQVGEVLLQAVQETLALSKQSMEVFRLVTACAAINDQQGAEAGIQALDDQHAAIVAGVTTWLGHAQQTVALLEQFAAEFAVYNRQAPERFMRRLRGDA